jgi:hypothetical protein
LITFVEKRVSIVVKKGDLLPGGKDATLFLGSKWIVNRIGASPDAARAPIQVACQAMRAAVGKNAGGLVWQEFWGINNFCFQSNFFIYMMAVLNL